MTRIAPAHPGLPDSIAILAETPGSTGGHSFESLMAEVAGETGFKPQAHNRQTDATGPYQFIRSTWLELVRQHGKEVGIKASLVDEVKPDAHGHLGTSNAKDLADILALRQDPVIATRLAAKYLDQSRSFLAHALKRDPTDAEVHIAYLLGPTGAAHLIQAASRSPDQPVEDVIGAAARSNRSLFSKADGGARSAAESVAFLTHKYQSDKATAAAYIRVAQAQHSSRKVDA